MATFFRRPPYRKRRAFLPISSGLLVSAGAGDADGLGEALADAIATAEALAAASAIGAATADGAQIAEAVASASGVGASSVAGAQIAAADGVASGVGDSSVVGDFIAISAADGAAAGVGAASADGASVNAGDGSAAGVGAAAADGITVAAATASAIGTGAASAGGAEIFYLRPDGDVATDGWTDELDGVSSIYQSIDEAALNDADYVQSPSVAGSSADLVVRLYEGATLIAEWTHTDIGDTFVTATQTLTTPEFETIGNFGNLFVELDDDLGNVYRFPVSDPASGAAEPVKLHYRYKKLAA